ncbi:MAG: AAA family ATPase [Gemmatimonadaceae bacterium]
MTPDTTLRITRKCEPEDGSVIELHTLGDAMIKVGEKEIRPTARMVFAALLYLCIERGRRVPRTALQELLFPNAGERSGAHSLRQLLYKLRQLGVPLETDDSSVTIAASAVAIDNQFIAPDSAVIPEQISSGLLPGYDGDVSPSFQHWLEELRATTGTALRSSLIRRLAHSRSIADYEGVHRSALAMLKLDPLNEEAVYALAEVFALTGKKAEAIRVLDDYSAELGPGAASLQLAPALLKRRLVEVICRHDQQQPPFVGRQQALSPLSRQFARSAEGNPSVSFLWGSAGIGKTRLLREFEKYALLQRARCVWAHCHEYDVHRPLGAFVDLVPTLLAAPGALGVSPTSMDSLRRLASAPASDKLLASDSAEVVATGIREALTDLILCVAEERTLVLLIEDAHWLDQVSLQLLLSFLPEQRARLHIAVTSRQPPRFDRIRLAQNVFVQQLEPLSNADARVLIDSLLTSPDSAESEREQCLALAGGNPLFLCTLAEHLRWSGTTPPASSRIADLLQQRTRVLEPRALLLLRCIAVFGKHGTHGRLSDASGLPADELLLALQQLGDQSLVMRINGSIACCHDLLESAVISDSPESLMCALYERVAQVLEKEGEANKEAPLLWTCADLWARSGHRSSATKAFRKCARSALEVGQPLFATDAIERALEMCDETQRLELLADAAIAAKQSDNAPLVVRNIARLKAAYRTAGRHLPEHGQFELDEINAIRRSGRSIWEYRDRLRRCATSPDATTEHRLEAARYFLYTAEQNLAREEAVALFHSVDLLRSRVQPADSQCLQFEMVYHCCFGDMSIAGELATQLLDTIRRNAAGLPYLNLGNAGVVLFRAGRLTEALGVLTDAHVAAVRFGQTLASIDYAAFLSYAHNVSGDPVEAEIWYARADAICEQNNVLAIPHYHLFNRIEAALLRGDAQLAQQHMLRARDSFADISAGYPVRAKHAFDILLRRLDASLAPDVVDLDELRRLDNLGRNTAEHDIFAFALSIALEATGDQEEARHRLQQYLHRWRRERHPLPKYLHDHIMKFGIAEVAAPNVRGHNGLPLPDTELS